MPSRRFLVPLLAAALCAAGALVAPDARAGEQAYKAVAAARKLIASGQVPAGSRLTLGFKQGNVNAFLGTDLALQKEWENLTGIVLDVHIVPQQPIRETLRGTPDIDIAVARNHEYPDLLADGLITDIGPFMAEYGYRFDDNDSDGYIRPELQSKVGERTVAIPADGDVVLLYLRRDLMENAQEQAAFRKTYGRALAAPKTWAEYEDLVRFFHRPAQGLYGAAEERDEEGAWMFWMPRFLSSAAPHAELFDEQMRPRLDMPGAIAATENYIALVKYSPPGITDAGRNYNFTLPLFAQGKAFATMNTIAAARMFNTEGSAVRGKFAAVPLPGGRVDNRTVRHNTLIYGNNLVIPKSARNARLAFLYAMWLTDPDVSTRSIGVAGGFADPYRWNHLRDARIRKIYTPEALETFSGEWAVTQPAGTGLRGDAQYLAALDRNLTAAARGEIGAQEAMNRTSSEWEQITDKLGRAEQIRQWAEFRRQFGNRK
ncbi:carbohydrate ABC transporter substrate-binding protein, CUT1 family [Aromatoleum tolulyticum]|uniref:Carbohydrate ABC transporter substrate-binding protein, CUT1 family n=1 Tax=Aromatoleum tolulyticum TaxID=34027 RepID=A0A1N6SS84_9RHOO|nr:extracellular solute-binding protein [Aromatoleum tolulyticum]SIQ43766.1 carbohydrate ABC transporter substrate-binding protein, CUT1 family [Aromatoleum tolulyticum]